MALNDVKFCPECGSKNSSDKKFCGDCGASFEAAIKTAQPTQPTKTTEEKSSFSLGVVSLIASILGLSCFPLLGSFVAVITGFLTTDWKSDKFAVAGIIIGFISIAVLGGGLILLIAYLAMV